MTIRRAIKNNLIDDVTVFSNKSAITDGQIMMHFPHNFVDIVSLDSISGEPTTPSAGTYSVYVKTVDRGGFKSLKDGELDAKLTGGDSLADGLQLGVDFSANPIEIKVVPSGVIGAAAYKVVVTQNLT